MNHRVPDFELDDVYSLPTSSGLTRKSSMAEDDEIMELLWKNGHVVTQSSQNQRSGRRIPPTSSSEIRSAVEEEAAVQQDHLFIQEDEMASWLHYPLHETTFERDISDYFNPLPPTPTPMATIINATTILVAPPPPLATTINATISVSPKISEPLEVSTSIELKVQPPNENASLPFTLPTPPTRPPVPPSIKQKEVLIETPKPPRVQNFAHFTKLRMESGPSSSGKSAKESTVLESNDTQKISRVGSNTIPEGECGRISNSARELATTTMNTYDFATTSSPGDSSATMSAGGELPRVPSGIQEEERKEEEAVGEDRKRKGREGDDSEGHSLDTEFEFGGEKKQARGSTSTKRSRAAEVHNLSERRRRDRINERMKTLQELIPRCNKTDKASMLDEAIEYLKSLQLQVQMMSMGCGMVPIMYPGVHQYPGVQQYIPAMGMGMDMSMNRPLVPYPQMLQGLAMPNPAAGAHMAPRFPMQAFHMPVVHDPSRMQPPGAVDPMINPMAAHNPLPNFANPYQQYLGQQQGQVLIPQNQAAVQQTNAKPSSIRDDGNPENRQPDG